MKDNSDHPDDPKLYKIWFRTRVKAFAHDIAAQRLKDEARTEYKREIFWSVLAISLLVLGLSLSDESTKFSSSTLTAHDIESGIKTLSDYTALTSKALIILSSILSMISLYLSIISQRMDLILRQGQHRFISNLYLSLSQKVRPLESGLFNPVDKQYLILYLNDQIRDMISNAEAPTDEDYSAAHALMERIALKTYKAVADTFKPDIPNEKFDFNEVFKSSSNDDKVIKDTST